MMNPLSIVFICNDTTNTTAELNANIIGHERQMFYGGGVQPQQQSNQWWDVLGVGDRPNFSFNQNWHFRCPPTVFQTLKAGGSEHNFEVEAIIYDGSEHFFRHSFLQR